MVLYRFETNNINMFHTESLIPYNNIDNGSIVTIPSIYNIIVEVELKAYQQVHDMYMLPKKADNLFTMHFPLATSNLSLPQDKPTQVLWANSRSQRTKGGNRWAYPSRCQYAPLALPWARWAAVRVFLHWW